jgi:hypothetical protein
MVDDKGPAFPNAFPELQKLMEEVRKLRFMIAAIETSRTKTDEIGGTRANPSEGGKCAANAAVPELT